ncbi:probable disease resistance protein At1g58390 [Ziziphus jujuba]|uniref:Probable disease resistance protein At1g58390 n=1 Tax=Ziziphus jujuba TaxID=326968 RepID=A0ABM3ZTR5_ZIZJJ|nr:probable disease resistance protein At1g58390 [Ziziphus jujuba]
MDTHSFVYEGEVVIGREGDRMKILQLLLDTKSDHENVSVVNIVGHGGLGKTTLAQLVFNDEKVEKHFDLKDKLKEEFQGSARARQMQVLNLKREFETLRMKDSELVKDFIDKLMKVVNQIRILGEELGDRRVVEKVVVSLPEKFEAKISSLEESRDLNQISLSELVNALQATE